MDRNPQSVYFGYKKLFKSNKKILREYLAIYPCFLNRQKRELLKKTLGWHYFSKEYGYFLDE